MGLAARQEEESSSGKKEKFLEQFFHYTLLDRLSETCMDELEQVYALVDLVHLYVLPVHWIKNLNFSRLDERYCWCFPMGVVWPPRSSCQRNGPPDVR